MAKAKEFMFVDKHRETIWFSKDLDKLLEKQTDTYKLSHIYAILDTEVGEKLFTLDYAYSGEIIIMRLFLHKKYMLDYYWFYKVKEL